MKVANKEMSVRKLWTSNELLDAVSARKAVPSGNPRRGSARGAERDARPRAYGLSLERRREPRSQDRSRIFHRRHRPPACHRRRQCPSFVRRNALHRIDELCDRTPLDVRDAQRLVACLSEKSLIAFAVALMDMSDYDWPSHCDVTSVGALCEALYSCTSIHETVLLEDACAHLAHRRPDLLSSIGACAPDHYPMVADPFRFLASAQKGVLNEPQHPQRFIRQMLQNETSIEPSPEFSYNALIKSRQDYDAMYSRSIADPEAFWADMAPSTLTGSNRGTPSRNTISIRMSRSCATSAAGSLTHLATASIAT